MKRVVVIAGPNGAGKSTCAPALLQGVLGVDEFVNADDIARGLSAFAPESVAFEAGRIMLRRIRTLADHGASFGFETTLASARLGRWLGKLAKAGYCIHVVFLSLKDPRLAIARVQERVRRGGHFVDADTIVRRYERGLLNYRNLAEVAQRWQQLDNSDVTVAPAAVGQFRRSIDMNLYKPIQEEFMLESQRVISAAKAAVESRVDEHRRLGHPVAVARNGRVVWLGPDGNEVPPPQ